MDFSNNLWRQSIVLVVLCLTLSIKVNAQDSVGGHKILWKNINGRNTPYVAGVISVKTKNGVSDDELRSVAALVSGRAINAIPKHRWVEIEIPTASDPFEAASALRRNVKIENAIPVGVLHSEDNPNDPYYNGTSPASLAAQWGLKNTGVVGTLGADINIEQAWTATMGGSHTVMIILDSGVPLDETTLLPNHEDIDAARLVIGPDYTGDGKSVRDLDGHGTHVAGVCAASTNNSKGIAGIAGNSSVVSIQVFDKYGNGMPNWLREGIYYAIEYQQANPGIRVVVNFSGGISLEDAGVEQAITTAYQYGIMIVCAAGNYRQNSNENWWVDYPAFYSVSHPNVMSVGASTPTDQRASYSCYNVPPLRSSPDGMAVDIVAPGGANDGNPLHDIISTWPTYLGTSYTYISGTSMAAPFVTGTVALMLTVDPTLSPDQIKNILETTADDKGTPGKDKYFGWGRLNAGKAVNAVVQKTIGTSMGSGWNLTSVPVAVTDFSCTALYPGAQLVKGYVGGCGQEPASADSSSCYYVAQSLLVGQGYFVNYPNSASVSYTGKIIPDLEIPVYGGWNLIGASSWPFNLADVATTPGCQITSLITYVNGGYLPATTIEPGKGYWISVNNAGTLSMKISRPYNGVTSPLPPALLSPADGSVNQPYATGPVLAWNSAPGATSYTVLVATDNNLSNRIYQLSVASTSVALPHLDPGSVYYWNVASVNSNGMGIPSSTWMFSTSEVTGQPGPSPCGGTQVSSIEDLDRFVVSDASGQMQVLYVMNAASRLNLPFSNFDLPPELDRSSFSVRFASGKLIEKVTSTERSHVEVVIRRAKFPVRLAWDVNRLNGIEYWRQNIMQTAGTDSSFLQDTGSMVLNRPGAVIFSSQANPCPPASRTILVGSIKDESGVVTPLSFSLSQCYPNPFNPTTSIKYELPEGAYVSLRVFDILGREVATLVNGFQSSGSKVVEFDGTNLPNGMYIYRLIASGFADTKKMLLLK